MCVHTHLKDPTIKISAYLCTSQRTEETNSVLLENMVIRQQPILYTKDPFFIRAERINNFEHEIGDAV